MVGARVVSQNGPASVPEDMELSNPPSERAPTDSLIALLAGHRETIAEAELKSASQNGAFERATHREENHAAHPESRSYLSEREAVAVDPKAFPGCLTLSSPAGGARQVQLGVRH